MKTLTISDVRNATGFLDENHLSGILTRFESFLATSKKAYSRSEEAFADFFELVEYFDFLKFYGKEIEYEGETYIVKHPTKYGPENSIPAEASSPCSDRYGGHFSLPHRPKYPIDSDLRIYVHCLYKNPRGYFKDKNIPISFNELDNKCIEGREAHWSEGWLGKKQPEPTNEAIKDLGYHGLADPLYRKTPDGEQTVMDMLKPGMLIEIRSKSIMDRSYIVKSISGPHVYQPEERPEDHIFLSYSMTMIDPESKRGGYIYNSMVAVAGEIKKLFMSDDDEVIILGEGHDCVAIIEDEDEDEDEIYCDCAQDIPDKPTIPVIHTTKSKSTQLSLFS